MTLVVEDGTGITNANAYVSVSEANNYFTARNNTVWSSRTTPEKEAAILYATSYLDATFLWIGHITHDEQALGWPRGWAYDNEDRLISNSIVPQKVKDAACELALEALDTSLSPSLARGGDIKRQKVGTLEIEYFDYAKDARTFPILNQILNGFFKNNQGTIELYRA